MTFDVEEYRADLERRIAALDALADVSLEQSAHAEDRGQHSLSRAHTMSEITRRSKALGLEIALSLLPPKAQGLP